MLTLNSLGKDDTSLYLYQLLSDLHFDVQMGPEGCGLIVDDRSKPAVSRCDSGRH